MKNVYDIKLNFSNDYFDFFEWRLDDKIINVKKIKLYKVSSKDYLILKYNDVIVDNKFDKMILVSNGIEVMGLLFNKNGKLLKRSSLLFEQACDVLKFDLKSIKINYIENVYKDSCYLGRNYMEKNNYIDYFFKKIDFNKDEYLLKYIYYDITNNTLDDVRKIYEKLLDIRNKNYNLLYKSIYNIKKGI